MEFLEIFLGRSLPRVWLCIISIFHECMVWIEKSVTRVTDRHHEACRVMPNSDPECQIFLSHHTPMIDTFFAYLLIYHI